MNCRKVSHLLSAYMDGELPGVEYRQIHEHLCQCHDCHKDYEEILRVKRLLAGMRVQEPRAELPALILQKVAAADARDSMGWNPSEWFRHFAQQWKQVAPSTPAVAFGAGVMVLGMVWTVRVTDASDKMEFSPAPPTNMMVFSPSTSPSATSIFAADSDNMRRQTPFPQIVGSILNGNLTGRASLQTISNSLSYSDPYSFNTAPKFGNH